ncbi:hypothetical protein [Pseudomonas sp.]|uniref:hypothetical protein n=1 Tax=Pseudomonas sp. TaxID=306 RepID=UPI00289EF154|nr:hypothetical protein [Pseudomonas sp.]
MDNNKAVGTITINDREISASSIVINDGEVWLDGKLQPHALSGPITIELKSDYAQLSFGKDD